MDSNSGTKLPPLPASDPISLQYNRKDGFYNITSREFWNENEVNSSKIEDWETRRCNHYFQYVNEGKQVECPKCHMGFLGSIEIRDGQLYLEGNRIEF